MNETLRLLCAHRSIRRFLPDPVPEEHVAAAVRAGQMASTSHAVQAYCCIRVRDDRSRAALAGLAGPQDKVRLSPVFLVFCADIRRHKLLADQSGKPFVHQAEGTVVAIIDVALFAQNVCLAFESMGYGVCYIGGIRNDLGTVVKLLDLPHGVLPLFGMCVGKPAEDPIPRPRLPLEAVLLDERYPSDEEVLGIVRHYDELYREYLEQRGAGPVTWTAMIAGSHARAVRPTVGPVLQQQGARFD